MPTKSIGKYRYHTEKVSAPRRGALPSAERWKCIIFTGPRCTGLISRKNYISASAADRAARKIIKGFGDHEL